MIDRTGGFIGNFDLKMQWSSDNNPDAEADPLPDIFTAIEEQLGLRLQSSKGPVQTLVVYQASMPSDNWLTRNCKPRTSDRITATRSRLCA